MIAMTESAKARLDASVRRVRRIYLLRGIAATLAVAIAATLAAMSVDACFTLYSDAARWLLSAALYACVLAAAWLFLARPLSRRLDVRRMAKILDARHPEHEECLTTLVELVDSAARGDGRPGFSEALVGSLPAKAAAAAAAVDAEREFTSRTIVRRLKALGAIALLLLLSFVLAPHLAGRLFVRAVAPWVDVGNLYSGDIAVKPGDVVALAGTVVRIEAAVADGLHYAPSIRISRRTALGWGEEFADEMKDGVYEAIADLSEPEWRYRVSAGPAVTRHYTVRVCEMPRYESFTARIDYPAYTGRSPSVVSNDDVSALEAVEGSRVSFALDLGGRAVKASLRVDGRPADAHEMVSNRVSSWTLDLVGEEGFAAPRRGGQLRSFLDTPPTVVVERPAAKTLRLAPYVKFPLAVSASDDIGVDDAVLRWRADGGGWQELRPLASFAKTGASLWKGADEIDLSTLDLSGVRTVSFDVVVRDGFPAERGGPHAATSTPVVVQLEMNAASPDMQSLSEEAAAARRLLEEARRRLSDAVRQANLAKDQIRREQKVRENADRAVENAVHEASEARRRVDELEERLREDRRFEPIADMLKSVREEKLTPAQERLESAQFDEVSRRADALEAAAAEMREAMEALQKMDVPIRERVQRLENFEKTKDLAARQEALARAAEDIVREQPTDANKLEAWKRMETAAAMQANDLARKVTDGDLDSARRKMSRATELMDELKSRLQTAANRNLSEDKKAQALERLESELSRRRDEALAKAVAAEKEAERKIADASANGDAKAREELMRQAAAAQARAEDLLEQAEAGEAAKEAQHAATEERKGAMSADSAKDDAVARQGEALKAAEAELAAREKSRAEPSQPANQSQSSEPSQSDAQANCRGSAVGAKAAEAAEAMRREAARQAKALGMPEEQQSSGQSQGEMESRGQSGEESRSGGGGVAAEISELARKLERHDDPEAARQLLERLGWFKIKGAAKDGLGERDLKDIPAEYRDLVRSYFLKLAE